MKYWLLLPLLFLGVAFADVDPRARALAELIIQDRTLDTQDGGVSMALRRYMIAALAAELMETGATSGPEAPQDDSQKPITQPPEYSESIANVSPLSRAPRYGFGVETPTGITQGWVYDLRPGEPIIAVADGEVLAYENFAWRAHILIIGHGNSFVSVYQGALDAQLPVGARVESGQNVGIASTIRGESTMEWQVRVDGRPVDPSSWLQQR